MFEEEALQKVCQKVKGKKNLQKIQMERRKEGLLEIRQEENLFEEEENL